LDPTVRELLESCETVGLTTAKESSFVSSVHLHVSFDLLCEPWQVGGLQNLPLRNTSGTDNRLHPQKMKNIHNNDRIN
jgi:hypothetical protein